jgi:hypothetical protein
VVLLCSGLFVLAGSAAFGRLRHDEIDLRRLGDDPCA